jgi:hypothetical protein
MQVAVCLKKKIQAWHMWLAPVVLATQEAKIRRIVVQSQARQIVCNILCQTYPTPKRVGGVTQVVE